MRPLCGLVALVLLSFCGNVLSFAQDAPRQAVIISCSCVDTTGRAFAGALHDALGRSPRYQQVTRSAETDHTALRFSIVSLPLGDDTYGHSESTALSIVFLQDGVMLDHLIATCDRASVESCARSTIAAFDAARETHDLRAGR